jgi:hypothetical protein
MAANSNPALGTVLSYSTDGTAYTIVGQVTNISHAGGAELGERDTAVLASTAKTTRPTIPDFGELTFDVNWDGTDTAHTQLVTWSTVPTTADAWWKVTPPVGTAIIMKGWLKSFDGANFGGIDENVTASVTVKINSIV